MKSWWWVLKHNRVWWPVIYVVVLAVVVATRACYAQEPVSDATVEDATLGMLCCFGSVVMAAMLLNGRN